jgi:hypothetical protein
VVCIAAVAAKLSGKTANFSNDVAFMRPPNCNRFAMFNLLAHITELEVPSYWLATLIGFVAGVAVTYAMMDRKWK